MQRHLIKIVNVPVEKRYAEKMIADVPGNVLRGCDRFSASSGAYELSGVSRCAPWPKVFLRFKCFLIVSVISVSID